MSPAWTCFNPFLIFLSDEPNLATYHHFLISFSTQNFTGLLSPSVQPRWPLHRTGGGLSQALSSRCHAWGPKVTQRSFASFIFAIDPCVNQHGSRVPPAITNLHPGCWMHLHKGPQPFVTWSQVKWDGCGFKGCSNPSPSPAASEPSNFPVLKIYLSWEHATHAGKCLPKTLPGPFPASHG